MELEPSSLTPISRVETTTPYLCAELFTLAAQLLLFLRVGFTQLSLVLGHKPLNLWLETTNSQLLDFPRLLQLPCLPPGSLRRLCPEDRSLIRYARVPTRPCPSNRLPSASALPRPALIPQTAHLPAVLLLLELSCPLPRELQLPLGSPARPPPATQPKTSAARVPQGANVAAGKQNGKAIPRLRPTGRRCGEGGA